MNSAEFRQRFLSLLPPESPPPSPGGREAAVLVPVVPYPEPRLLLTKRATHLRHHPGQVAFPGGKRDPADRSLMQTALRETGEELGLSPSQIEIIGTLPAVSSQTGFHVTPFVALLSPGTPLTPEPGEVALSFEVPLAAMLSPANFFRLEVLRNGYPHGVWVVDYQKHFIWGMTAGIIRSLGKQITGE